MRTVRVTPVVGLPQFTGWSQVVDTVVAPGSHLTVVLSVKGTAAGTIGRELVSLVLEQKPSTAQRVYDLLEYLVRYSQAQGCELSVTAGLFYNVTCVVASYAAAVILRRDGKTGVLVQSNQEVSLVEGTMRDDDVFIFATAESRQFLLLIEQQFSKGYDVDGVITSTVPSVHGVGDSSLCALAFITPEWREDSVLAGLEPLQANEPEREKKSLSTEAVELPEVPFAAEEPPQVTVAKKIDLLGPLQKILGNILKLFSQKTYVGIHLTRKVVLWLVIVGVTVGLVVAVSFFLIQQRRNSAATLESLLTPYKERLQAAEVTAQKEPIQAREEVEQLVADITKLQSDHQNDDKQTTQAIATILSQAQQTLVVVSGKDEFKQLPILYDLRQTSNDFVTSLVTEQGTLGVFVDGQKKELIFLDLATKKTIVKNLAELPIIKGVAPLLDTGVVLLSEGIYSLEATAEGVAVKIKEAGDSNKAATYINSFGPYVYVFNPEKRNIYRYVKTEAKYSDPIGWLQGPLGVQFTSVSSLSIDGDLWITTTAGEIKKFSAGSSQTFSITGLSESFSSPIWLYTNEEQQNLYVLEPAKKRLVIISKDGRFLRQIVSGSLASATGVLANEQLKKAFAISGSIIYEIALN